MKTLIVGCGYLGRWVGRLLLREDRSSEVYGTSRSASGASGLESLGLRPIVAEVLDTASLARLPAVDQIVYCVGYDRTAGIPMRDIYVAGLGHLLDRLIADRWAGRFVYASSTGVYGQTDGAWVDESSPTEPKHASGIVCLEAEERLRSVSGLFTATTIRFAGLYGSGRIVRREAIARGEPIAGDPERWLNLIHIEDAAGAVLAVLGSTPLHPVYLACDDRPVRRREYYGLVARCLGAPAPKFLPPAPGSPEAARDESDKRISNRLIREEIGFAPRYPDITTGVPAALARE